MSAIIKFIILFYFNGNGFILKSLYYIIVRWINDKIR